MGFGASSANAQPYVAPVALGDGLGGDADNAMAYATVVANAAIGNIAAGTNYVFLNGTYEGTLQIISVNGTAAAPVVFEAAPGATPVFSGSRALGGWTNLGGGLFATTAIPSGINKVFNLYDDGALQTLARCPNAGFLEGEPLNPITGSLTDADLIAHPELPANTDLTGSRIVYRYANWGYATGEVFTHAQAAGVLTFTAVGTGNLFVGNWGYFLTNSLALLDSEGEWYYDLPSTTLYYRPIGGATPTNVRIASNLGIYGVEIKTSASEYLTFRGLTFEHYADDLLPTPTSIGGYAGGQDRGTGIRIRNGGHDHITVEQCTFRDLRIGIDDITSVPFSSHATYRANVFHNVYRSAIRSQCNNGTIEDNTLTYIAMIPGQTGHIFQMATGMDIISDAMTVRGNRLINIGGTGLSLGGNKLNMNDPNEHVVEHNYISAACAVLNDHGGIAFDGCNGLTIRNNVVRDLVPDTESSADGDFSSDKTVGIYFGEANPAFGNVITNTTVSGNTITNCATGIVVDNNIDIHDNRVIGNTVFGCRDVQLYFQDYAVRFNTPPYQAAYNTQVEDNILYCLSEEQYCMTQWNTRANTWNQTGTNGNDRRIVDFGDFSSNFYFNPYTRLLIRTSMFLPVNNSDEGRMSSVPRTLDHWQAERGEDLDSYEHPLEQQRFAAQTGTNPNLITNGSFGTNTSGWQYCDAHLPSGPFTGGAMTTTIPGCEWLENNSAVQSIADGTYLLTLSTTGLRDGAVKASIQITSNNPDGVWIPITEEGGTMQVLLEQPTTANGFLNLHDIDWWAQNSTTGFPGCMQPVSPYNELIFDEISLTLCDQVDYLTPAQVAEGHILRYYADLPGTEGDPLNTAATGGTFDLPAGTCWADVYNGVYSGTVNLQPWESKILYRLDMPAVEALNGTHITGTTPIVWNSNRSVSGHITVDNGATLIVDNCIIGFVESTFALTTDVVVAPGGTLIVRNNGNLTSLGNCGDPALWNGVKVLGTGSTNDAGLLVLESGGRISNALTAARTDDGAPTNPLVPGTPSSSGGIVQATNAIFENNMYDVAFLPHGDIDPINWGPSFFTNTAFRRSAALPYGNSGEVHVSLLQSAATEFIGCTFSHSAGGNPNTWGMGVQAIETRIRIADSEDGTVRSKMSGLGMGVLHSTSTPTNTADIDGCDFSGNARRALLYGSTGSRIINSTFQVPDVPVNEPGAAAAYGSYLFGCTGFEVEENTYTGTGGTDHPKVGAIFRSTGSDYNQFSRNSFNAFAGAGVSAGTIIMGNNGGALPDDGLHWRCNQYSNTDVNDHDVAFTSDGVGVTIGQYQGTNINDESPAANTFANYDEDCGDGSNDNAERHLYVHPDAVSGLNVFEYWHHVDVASTEYRPHCDTDPPIVVDPNPAISWIKESTYDYSSDACPLELSREQEITDVLAELESIASDHKELAEVYGDWTDGGDTDGLKYFILDPANGSYAVRNKLMLVAPKVSHENWERAFFRTPAMDPWHLAQGLIANSPLPLPTLVLLDSSLVNPYFKQLVLNAQNGGTSMHTLYQSELSYLYGRASNAAYSAVALARGNAVRIDDALDILGASKLRNKERLALALWLANGDQSTAYALIDSMRTANPGEPYWTLQGILMDLDVQDLGPTDIDATGIAVLQAIAQPEKEGCGQARAWLLLLGESFNEPIVLPTTEKRAPARTQAENGFIWHPLAVFPNPSKGPVSIVYEVPDVVTDAQVRVVDAHGRLTFQQSVKGKGIVQLDVPRSAPGLHIIGLYYDGQLIGTEKLELVR